MSLVSTLMNGGLEPGYVNESKYTHEDGALRIATESVEELHDIFLSSTYLYNQAEINAIHEGVSLEYSEWSVVAESAIGNGIQKIKEFFKKLWGKVKSFLKNIKMYLDAMFMKAKEFVKKYKKVIQEANRNLKDFEYKMFEYDDAKLNDLAAAEAFDVSKYGQDIIDKVIDELGDLKTNGLIRQHVTLDSYWSYTMEAKKNKSNTPKFYDYDEPRFEKYIRDSHRNAGKSYAAQYMAMDSKRQTPSGKTADDFTDAQWTNPKNGKNEKPNAGGGNTTGNSNGQGNGSGSGTGNGNNNGQGQSSGSSSTGAGSGPTGSVVGKTIEEMLTASKKLTDEDTVAKSFAADLSLKSVSGRDDINEACFAIFRNGATSAEDKETIDIKDLNKYIDAIENSKSAKVDKYSKNVDKAYNNVIKAIDNGVSEINKIDKSSKTAQEQTDLSNTMEILRNCSKGISLYQGYHNTYLSAWKTAISERDNAYKSMLLAACANARKSKSK